MTSIGKGYTECGLQISISSVLIIHYISRVCSFHIVFCVLEKEDENKFL